MVMARVVHRLNSRRNKLAEIDRKHLASGVQDYVNCHQEEVRDILATRLDLKQSIDH